MSKGNIILALPSPRQRYSSSLSAKNKDAIRLRINLAGASPAAEASQEDPRITRMNYFIGSDPTRWLTNVPTYGRIRYRSIYPGIDVVYYGSARRLEHDFVVAPHADPGRIVFSFPAGIRLSTDSATGDLLIGAGTAQSSLRLLKPVAYQPGENANGRHNPVSSNYRLLKDNQVAFTLGRYDPSHPLIIDPVLAYSTYLGGSGIANAGDQGNGIAVDAGGNAYIVGTTYSTDFPVTTSSFQTKDNAATGEATVFVSKLSSTGTALIYSSFLGGSGGDLGFGIALDAANNAYITGSTGSMDFPVTCNALLPANPSKTAGAPTGFVAKLTANGDALAYSTYLGGSGSGNGSGGDVSQAIAVDSAGDAYVTGYTYSADFPVTANAFQTAFAGNATNSNAFAAKLNPGGTALAYATYIGGSGSPQGYGGDFGNSIAIDSAGNAYIAGTAGSADFPVSSGALKSYMTAPTNGFVIELNPAATAAVFSTYLGGSGDYTPYGDNAYQSSFGDTAGAIAVDSSGSIYVAGNAVSGDFPVTAGVLEGSSDFDGSAGFVTKFNKGGATLAYSTYLQGSGTTVSAMTVDSSGTAYITGVAPRVSAGQPAGFQLSKDALTTPPNAASYSAPFLVKLNPTATAMNYASLFGGSANDSPMAIAVDAAGDVFITGSTASTDFPVTQGAFQSTNKAEGNATNNAFIAKLALAGETGSTTYSAPPTGLASTFTITNNSIAMYCDGFPGDNAFTMTVGLTLTTAAGGPPPTGVFTFLDSLNWTYDGGHLQPYTVQVDNTWGGAPTSFEISDGESYDGPTGPFSISWTASYSGDSVYAPATISGSASGPGCPSSNSAPNSTTRRSGPRRSGPHVEILTSGEHRQSPKASRSSLSPSATNQNAAASSRQLPGLQGAKFAPPSPNQDKLSLHGSETTPQAPACLAPPQTVTPVFSLASGIYSSSQSLTITDATSGAAIYYTTNGSTPTPNSALYSAPITISTTETVNAIAVAAGYTGSAVASATYTITPPAATPAFSPQPGTYLTAQIVTLADATPGASIYYTTDGSAPSASATLYSGSISVYLTETINAIAITSGYTASPVASATYTITPTFSASAGTTSLTIAAGQSITDVISVAPEYGFTGPVTFSCSGLPANLTCTFSPTAVTPAAGVPAITTLTLSASTSASLHRPDPNSIPHGPIPATPVLALAFAIFNWRRPRFLSRFLLLAAITSSLALLSACGGSSSSRPPVTSTVSVVASSGAQQRKINLAVTVQ